MEKDGCGEEASWATLLSSRRGQPHHTTMDERIHMDDLGRCAAAAAAWQELAPEKKSDVVSENCCCSHTPCTLEQTILAGHVCRQLSCCQKTFVLIAHSSAHCSRSCLQI